MIVIYISIQPNGKITISNCNIYLLRANLFQIIFQRQERLYRYRAKYFLRIPSLVWEIPLNNNYALASHWQIYKTKEPYALPSGPVEINRMTSSFRHLVLRLLSAHRMMVHINHHSYCVHILTTYTNIHYQMYSNFLTTSAYTRHPRVQNDDLYLYSVN